MLVRREIGDILGGRVHNLSLLEPALQTWRILPNGGGVIFNRSIHSIDLVRWLLRDEIASVYARSTLQILSNVVEEDVVCQFEMRRTGRIIQVHDSFLVPHNTTKIEIYGSAGTLVARNCFVDEPASELLLVQNQRRMVVPLEAMNPYQEIDRPLQRRRARPGPAAGRRRRRAAQPCRRACRTRIHAVRSPRRDPAAPRAAWTTIPCSDATTRSSTRPAKHLGFRKVC